MNTLFPELINEEDEAMFSANLFKLYKLDERCGKLEAPSFRVLYLKDKNIQLHIDARTISKKLYNKIHDHYFNFKKKIF
jgi:hypothetical protein